MDIWIGSFLIQGRGCELKFNHLQITEITLIKSRNQEADLEFRISWISLVCARDWYTN